MRKTPLKRVSKTTGAKLKAKLDKVFSEYIRQKYADKNGLATCFTCTTRKPWREMQCGHFEKRHNLCTRWEEKNCRVQCAGCNVFRDGNYPEFAYQLEKEKRGSIAVLNKLKHQVCKFSPYDYEVKIKEFEDKINNL